MKNKYTPEKRAAVVARSYEIGIKAAGKEFGISRWTIREWRKPEVVHRNQQEKEEILQAVENNDIHAVAAKYSVSRRTIKNWQKRGIKATSTPPPIPSPEPKTPAEIRGQLQRRIELLKVELNTLLEVMAQLNSL